MNELSHNEIVDELNSAGNKIDNVFAQNGTCGKYLEWLTRLKEVATELEKIGMKERGIVETTTTTVTTTNTVTSEVKERNLWCNLHDKLPHVCRACEESKDLTYCQTECYFCVKQIKNYERTEDAAYRGFYRKVANAKIEACQKRTTKEKVKENKEMYNRSGNFGKKEKFIGVTYTISDTDIIKSNWNDVEEQLRDNFMKLTKLVSYPCKAYAYVIDVTKKNTPHIHGILRLSEEKRRIHQNEPVIHGKNKVTINGEYNCREEDVVLLNTRERVEGWIKYIESKDRPVTGNMEGVKEGL